MKRYPGVAVVVMAKAPVAGRSKTRLCPPCSPEQAARLAQAALADTLDTVAACGAGRRVLALDGAPGPWLPEGFEVIAQRGSGLGSRLAAAVEDVGAGPLLVIGMDTPQLSTALLHRGFDELRAPRAGAVLGLAEDGGWWALGLPSADASVFEGVPVSAPETGARQRDRLLALGYRVSSLPRLRDVDRWVDAAVVARLVPASRFGRLVAELAA